MATRKVVMEGSNVSASQLKELFRQIAECNLDGEDLQAFLEHRNPWPKPTEVTLGQYKSGKSYKDALKKMGCNLGSCYIDLLSISIAQESHVLKLAYVTAEELGFKEKTSYQELCAAAQRRGLQLCPAEVGPALRLALKKRPTGEWAIVGMEPDAGDGKDDPLVYNLGTEEDDKYILSVYGPTDTKDGEVEPDWEFVFVRP